MITAAMRWVAALGVVLVGMQISRAATASEPRLPEGAFADLPTVRLHYRDTGGTGDPVIFLHALTGNADSWQYQYGAFAAAGFRAIGFDRRGWGRSAPKPGAGVERDTAAADIDDLATHLGFDRFHLVGIAGGGFVAMDYAAWHPERLRSLTIAASTLNSPEAEIVDFSRRIRIPGATWPDYHLEIGPNYIGSNPTGIDRWLAIEHASRQKNAEVQPLRSPNTYEKVAGVDVPMLVIAGGADLLAPPALMRLWVNKAKAHEWAELPAAGHSLNWEQPVAFNERVTAFLRQH